MTANRAFLCVILACFGLMFMLLDCDDGILHAQTCEEDLETAKEIIRENIDELETSKTLLEEERDRWREIHLGQNNTISTMTRINESTYKGKIIIDTGISNVINALPIERTVTVKVKQTDLKYIPFDFMIMAGLTKKLEPSVGLGLTLLSLEPLPIKVIDKIRFNVAGNYPLGCSINLLYNFNFLIFKYSYITVGVDLVNDLVFGLSFKL